MKKNSRRYKKLVFIRSKNSIRKKYGKMPEDFVLTWQYGTISMKNFLKNGLILNSKKNSGQDE
jgi:hypothetical protein